MWFRKRTDQDFAEEIAAHLELETDRLIAAGMSPAEARTAAARAFGNRTVARERFHESTAMVPLEQVMQDLRYAVRALRRTPGFALVAVLCLGVGISVNTAAFSVINAVAFRDYPGVVRQRELVSVQIGWETSWGRATPDNASLAEWEMLRAGMPVFSGIAAFTNLPLSVNVAGEPQATRGALVSPGYFEVLGTRPFLGRFQAARDEAAELEQSVVISYACWQRRFAARADIIGQSLTVGTRPFTIIGVAPEGFFGLSPGEVIDPDIGTAELFVPMAAAPFLRAGMTTNAPAIGDRWLRVFGRLRPGATLADAEAQAASVAAQLAAAYPAERRNAFAAVRAAGDRAANTAELVSAILFVMAVPVIILLVACANLANQLLARAIQRSREIAVRLSLGATRARVVRQLLVETALLAVVASGIGIVLARWILDLVRAWFLALPFRIPIDLRVLAFTIGLAVITALAFGLLPALRATRSDLTAALKDGGGAGYRRSRLRSALVVAQIAASLALTAVSTVFVRAGDRPPSALDALPNRLLLVSANLDLLGFDSLAGRAYQAAVLERLGRLPGVAAAGMAPFSLFDMLGGTRTILPGQDAERAEYNDVGVVSGAWFEATNTAAVRGRLFTAAEQAGTPSVAVIDEVMTDLWAGADPVGKTLRIGEDSAAIIVTVVGVVPTRQEVSFREPEGIVFLPGGGRYHARTIFYVRTNADADAMVATIRQAVSAVDPRVPILWVRTLEEASEVEAAPLTMLASGLNSLGRVALALAALGLFGVLSFIVAQRRYEIGIRVALGARRLDVMWMVLRQALGLGLGGVAAGMVLAVGTVVMIRAIIHGLQPLDLAAFGVMSATMVLVALVASALPARRAASVDPLTALRAE